MNGVFGRVRTRADFGRQVSSSSIVRRGWSVWMIKMARVPIVSVLLLTCFVLRCHSLVCPPSCSCRGPSVLNCSLAGLWTMPKIPDSVTHLDVSHNGLERVALLRRTLPRLRSLSLANNSIARLSLCIHGRVQGRGCDSWAPNLHLLSVERNQLRRLPRGESQES